MTVESQRHCPPNLDGLSLLMNFCLQASWPPSQLQYFKLIFPRKKGKNLSKAPSFFSKEDYQ